MSGSALSLLLPAAAFSTLRATFSQSFTEHVSELMPVYLDATKNPEWNSRMASQQVLNTADVGDVVHQKYRLPWPLKPRELLMKCENAISQREHTVTVTCRSVESVEVPVSDSVVRMEILESQWRFRALPGNGRIKTRVDVYILISDKFAVGMRARLPPLPKRLRPHLRSQKTPEPNPFFSPPRDAGRTLTLDAATRARGRSELRRQVHAGAGPQGVRQPIL